VENKVSELTENRELVGATKGKDPDLGEAMCRLSEEYEAAWTRLLAVSESRLWFPAPSGQQGPAQTWAHAITESACEPYGAVSGPSTASIRSSGNSHRRSSPWGPTVLEKMTRSPTSE
jgi:hypothetical protein